MGEKREEGRGKREEGRGKREEGRGGGRRGGGYYVRLLDGTVGLSVGNNCNKVVKIKTRELSIFLTAGNPCRTEQLRCGLPMERVQPCQHPSRTEQPCIRRLSPS